MKVTLSIALLFVAGYLSPATAAHAQNVRMRANIPFNFSSGSMYLPAGVYKINTVNDTPVISISDDQSHQTMLLGRPEPDTPGNGNILVFHKYGNQYFLSAIHCEGGAPNVQLPLSKAEKRAKQKTQEAGLRIEDPILVAMN